LVKVLGWLNGTNDVAAGPPMMERIDIEGRDWTYKNLQLLRPNSTLKVRADRSRLLMVLALVAAAL